MRLDGVLLTAFLRTQKVIAHSFCEAEVVAIRAGLNEGQFIKNLFGEMSLQSNIIVYTDACNAIQFAMKRGVGRMKHIQLKYVGLQDDLRDGTFVMEYTKTEDNTADFFDEKSEELIFQ